MGKPPIYLYPASFESRVGLFSPSLVSLLLVTPYPIIYVVVWVRRLSLALSLVGPLFGGLSRPLSCVRGRCGAPLALESLGALALPDD